MQVYVRPDLLRFGAEHGRAAWRHLHQYIHLRSRRDPRLHPLHILDELEVDGPSMERNIRTDGSRNTQLYLHSVDRIQLVRTFCRQRFRINSCTLLCRHATTECTVGCGPVARIMPYRRFRIVDRVLGIEVFRLGMYVARFFYVFYSCQLFIPFRLACVKTKKP